MIDGWARVLACPAAPPRPVRAAATLCLPCAHRDLLGRRFIRWGGAGRGGAPRGEGAARSAPVRIYSRRGGSGLGGTSPLIGGPGWPGPSWLWPRLSLVASPRLAGQIRWKIRPPALPPPPPPRAKGRGGGGAASSDWVRRYIQRTALAALATLAPPHSFSVTSNFLPRARLGARGATRGAGGAIPVTPRAATRPSRDLIEKQTRRRYWKGVPASASSGRGGVLLL